MPADGTYTAVLDRIEAGVDGDVAVLILEDDGEAVDDLIVPIGELPDGGREPDTVIEVVVEDGELASATVDEAETQARSERAQDRFDRLSRRLSDEEDEDDDSFGE